MTFRQELKRFQREGLGYSKDLETHKQAVALFLGVYNFVRRHHTLGTTPAVAAGLLRPQEGGIMPESLDEGAHSNAQSHRVGISQSSGLCHLSDEDLMRAWLDCPRLFLSEHARETPEKRHHLWEMLLQWQALGYPSLESLLERRSP